MPNNHGDQQQRSLNRHDLLAVGLLILLILLFAAPALMPGQVFLPLDIVIEGWPPWQQPNQPVDVHNFMLADVVNYIVPIRQFLVDSVRSGEFPLWNPYVLTGYPFTYNTQAAMFYPLTVLYYLLPLTTAVDLTILLQMILGAIFMYAYLRQINLKPLAGIVGTVVFLFNGLMIVWVEWQVVHAAVIWLPLQLLLVERIYDHLNHPREGSKKSVIMLSIGSGLVFALPWLGGHWNWTLYTTMTLAVYMLWRFGPLLWQAANWPARRQIILPVIITFGVGIGLALVQVLPAFLYLSQTHRQPLSFIESQSHGLLDRFIAILIPNFFGSPIHENWWGPWNHVETTFYMGIMPLFLALLSLFLRRDRFTIFFALWGLLGLLWTLGTPVYRILHILPVFNGLFPSRAAFIVTFTVSVLSAISVDALMKRPLPSRRVRNSAILLALLGILLLAAAYFWIYRAEVTVTWDYLQQYVAIFALFAVLSLGLIWARWQGWLSSRAFGGLALLLVVIDLFLFGYNYNTVSSVADWYPQTAVASFLQDDPAINRIVTPAEGIVYPPDSSLIDYLPNVSGYEPGILQRSVEYMNAAEGESAVRFGRVLMPLKGLNSPLLDVLNVKYIVTTSDLWFGSSEVDTMQESSGEWLSLDPAERFEQMIQTSDAGFHRLDLQIQPENTPEGSVTVRIFTADGILELANSELNISELVPGDWNSFYFTPFPSEWGREFLVTVELNGPSSAISFGAAQNDGSEDGDNQQETVTSNNLAFAAYFLPRPELLFEDGKSRIYQNQGHFERAFWVPQAIVAGTEEEALAAINQHAEELDQIAVLELNGQPPPLTLGKGEVISGQVSITEYGLNRVAIETDTDAPGFLVLADTYYPGWRARIDGESTPVYQANYLLRAIYLPAGTHSVVFSFLPWDFILGAIVSIITLAICIALLVLLIDKRHVSADKDSLQKPIEQTNGGGRLLP